MKFEPSYRYLINLFIDGNTEEEAVKIVDRVINDTELKNQMAYGIDDFIKICEELKKNEERRIRTIALSTIAQAIIYRMIQASMKFKCKQGS